MELLGSYVVAPPIDAMKKMTAHFLRNKTNYIELHDKLVDQGQKTEEHFQVLLEADMKVAVNAFERGLKLTAASRSKKEDWEKDFEYALEKAQEGFAKVSKPEQKIKCYDIMCVCFFALKEDGPACISILHETKRILEDPFVASSLKSLSKKIKNSHALSKADAEVLKMLFKSICDAIEVCAKGKNWCSEHRQGFRDLFRSNKYILRATNPSMYEKWDYLPEKKTNSYFFSYQTTSDVAKFRDILTDLCQSDTIEAYPLGSIEIVQDGSTLTVVRKPARNSAGIVFARKIISGARNCSDTLRKLRHVGVGDMHQFGSIKILLLGLVLIAIMLYRYRLLLIRNSTPEEFDDGMFTTFITNVKQIMEEGIDLIQ